jgi:hypothetical protein
MKPDPKWIARTMLAAALLLTAGAQEAWAGSRAAVRPLPGSQEHALPGWSVARSGMRSDQNDAREGVRAGRILPLSQVLGRVRAQYPGQLLDAQLVGGGGQPVYLIKLLMNDGSVAIVSADAATGRILGYRRGGQ